MIKKIVLLLLLSGLVISCASISKREDTFIDPKLRKYDLEASILDKLKAHGNISEETLLKFNETHTEFFVKFQAYSRLIEQNVKISPEEHQRIRAKLFGLEPLVKQIKEEPTKVKEDDINNYIREAESIVSDINNVLSPPIKTKTDRSYVPLKGTHTLVLTIPLGRVGYIQKVTASGVGYIDVIVSLNGEIIDRVDWRYAPNSPYELDFDRKPYRVNADVSAKEVKVEVINSDSGPMYINATIFYYIQ